METLLSIFCVHVFYTRCPCVLHAVLHFLKYTYVLFITNMYIFMFTYGICNKCVVTYKTLTVAFMYNL